jgi:hypothetical protein
MWHFLSGFEWYDASPPYPDPPPIQTFGPELLLG